MLTIIGLLVIGALVGTLVSAIGKCPLWVPVLLLAIIEGLRVLPLGR